VRGYRVGVDIPEARRIREAGLRLTRARLGVLAALDDAGTRGEHPLVAEIAESARLRIGDVSTQAVYDVLEAMTEAGLIRRVDIGGSPARYESRVGDNHHHLVCRRCDAIVDVDCASPPAPCLQPSSAHAFIVDEAEVTFWGLCPSCSALEREPADAPIQPRGSTS
jgi:Fe2+ or Zn2+ uptake regulation protein